MIEMGQLTERKNSVWGKIIFANLSEGIDFGDTPEHQTAIINTEAKIPCTPTAKPAPLVDWVKDGVSIRNSK